MPWNIKKNGEGKYCLFKKDDDAMVKGSCHDSRSETAAMMAAMYASEGGKKMQLALAMKNPVWLGCAVTNRPHIRLKEHPLSVVELDGKKFIRVPMMKAGKYKHPQGDLDMTGDVLDQFIENHKKSLADFEVVLDAKHQPDRGALGLFEVNQGAFVQREKAGMPQVSDPNGELLVAYAIPTGDDAVETIERGRFRHASMEFHPDYASNVTQTYLSSDLTEIEETVQLGGPGSGKKGHGGGFSSGLRKVAKAADRPFAAKRKVAKGAFGAAKKVFGIKRKLAKKGAKAFASPFKAYGKATKTNFNRFKKAAKLEEGVQLNSLLPVYDNLTEYIEHGQDDEFAFFDTATFDFSETDLPIEEGFYIVDKQTAEEMLAVLDELAQDEEFSHLFIESEEDMPDVEEVVDEDVQELQVKLEAANQAIRQLQKSNLESSVRALVADLKNLREEGYGFTAVTLNLAEALMLGNPIGEGEGVIKLEDHNDPGAIAAYFRRGMVEFLKSALIRAKVESTTIPQTQITLERSEKQNGVYEQGKADAPSFWSQRF